jgi:hypothetical protein
MATLLTVCSARPKMIPLEEPEANHLVIIEADFNSVQDGRIDLSRMERHRSTPFSEIAALDTPVLFVDYEEAVVGRLHRDASTGHWFAVPDWSTQHQVVPMLGRPAYEGFRQRAASKS